MQNNEMAVFALPNGARFSLLTNGEWNLGVDVPTEVKQMIELTPANQYEDPVTHSLSVYISTIATLTGATVIGQLRADPAPPDAVF